MADRPGSNGASLRELAEGMNVATQPDPLVLALEYVEMPPSATGGRRDRSAVITPARRVAACRRGHSHGERVPCWSHRRSTMISKRRSVTAADGVAGALRAHRKPPKRRSHPGERAFLATVSRRGPVVVCRLTGPDPDRITVTVASGS